MACYTTASEARAPGRNKIGGFTNFSRIYSANFPSIKGLTRAVFYTWHQCTHRSMTQNVHKYVIRCIHNKENYVYLSLN